MRRRSGYARLEDRIIKSRVFQKMASGSDYDSESETSFLKKRHDAEWNESECESNHDESFESVSSTMLLR